MDDTFRLVVTSGFSEDGVWVIDIGIEHLGGPQDLGAVRLAVLQAVAREGLRGRALNAQRVRVHLDPTVLDLDASLARLTDTVH